jgi:phosphate transport system permease protein
MFGRSAARTFGATKLFSVVFSSVAATFLVLLVVLYAVQSLPVVKEAGWQFLTGKNWYFRTHQFGVAPMLYGTLAVAAIALILAAPIGIASAIFCSEYLPERIRIGFKILIELLAGIPSVVYGLLGILFLRNWVYQLLTPFDPLSGDTLITAAILLAIMILPTIMTLADDAFRSVPQNQRAAARSLGLTRSETILEITLPQARRGVIAAVLLALGRALGEMIAVFLVVGRQDNQWPEPLWSLRPLIESGQTLSSKLGSAETNIAFGNPLHWAAMVGLGLILLSIVTSVTIAAGLLEKRSDA